MLDKFKKSSQQLLDLLFPRLCVNCRYYGDFLCQSCIDSVEILTTDKNQDKKQILCATDYNNKVVRKTITSMKYDGLQGLDIRIAELMHKFIKQNRITFSKGSVITFVPMHKDKQTFRGFNQAELIAQKLSVMLNLPCFTLLEKIRRTPSQMLLKREQRLTNLKGAFESRMCEGENIILIDDVTTTGATLRECESELYMAGAASVTCFAFCRD